MKIADKMNDSIKAGKTFFSFEFFPPRTAEVNPTTCFCDVLSLPDQCRVPAHGSRLARLGVDWLRAFVLRQPNAAASSCCRIIKYQAGFIHLDVEGRGVHW
jgi:hypothetical protein